MLAFFLKKVGVNWNHTLNGTQAMTLVIIAAAWREVSYNFLFFLAGLQSIPHSFIEAAAIDGAGPWRRFWTIVFPLLSPTMFFLIVVNIVYAFFDTFGVIHALTRGGPYYATNILVYKVSTTGSSTWTSAARRAVGGSDDRGDPAHRGPVPLHRTQGPLLIEARP